MNNNCEHELIETPSCFYNLFGVEKLCCEKCNKNILFISEARFINYFVIIPSFCLVVSKFKK